MKRLLMRSFVLITLISLSSLIADSGSDDIDYDDLDEKHLYLDNPNQIKDMDTVTYLVGVKDKNIVKIFKKFSIDLGKTNGGVNLLHNTNKYLNYIKESECPFSNAKTFILFEERETKTCISMIITDEVQILNKLNEIDKLIHQDNKKLTKAQVKNQVENFVNSSKLNEELKASLISFVNWILPINS